MVYTDHKNLEYYRKPQSINCHVTQYLPHLADYNFQLVHVPGTTNKEQTRYPEDQITMMAPQITPTSLSFHPSSLSMLPLSCP